MNEVAFRVGPAPFWLLAVLASSAGLAARAQQSRSAAEPSSKPSVKHLAAPAIDAGSIRDGVYRNPTFGFSYEIPFGWVDRTSDMQEGSVPGKSHTLLAVFERPPEATGAGVNSSVIIVVESASSYPGLKRAVDYFGPLTEVVTSKGFKVTEEPYEFVFGLKQLVRGDFSKQTERATIFQSSFVTLEKGNLVSFTFISGNQDETDELLGHLKFGTLRKPSH